MNKSKENEVEKEFVLTPYQQKAITSINEFLDTKNIALADRGEEEESKYDHIFTLSGIAGSGKSSIIKMALDGRDSIVGGAISHSAKEVLEEAMGIKCFTIASLLGLQQTIDEDGNIVFKPKARGSNGFKMPIEYSGIVIIDECSMIDKEIFDIINDMVKPEAKIIYMGDRSQLMPVQGNEDSVTFNHTQAILDKAVRYSGPIADLGNRIREEISLCDDEPDAGSKNMINDWMHEIGNDDRISKINDDGSGYIFLNNVNSILTISNKFYSGDDPDALRIIAYKNDSISKINKAVRQRLYDPNKEGTIPQFMPGELLISRGGYAESVEANGQVRSISVINNGKSLTVATIKEAVHYDVDCYEITFKGNQVKHKSPIHVVRSHAMHQYNAKFAELKETAKGDRFQWKYVYEYKDKFAWFDYGYTCSSHKSQGRTYENAIVFEDDIFKVRKADIKNKLQSLYVSCTRAKKIVFIFNKNYRVDQSELPESMIKEFNL